MSSKATVECGICFNAHYKFKVLNCKSDIIHEFCVQCCEKIQKPLGTFRNGNTDRGSNLVPETVIECPTCRSVTFVPNNGVEGLKSHFVGYLMCYQCDTEKLTKDFQWCQSCNRSVCSTCFIEKHADGNGFHGASKWDSYLGVKAAVSRLKQMSLNHNQITEMCKADVAKYLDGLNVYLAKKVDGTSESNQASFSSMANKISQTYDMGEDELSASMSKPDEKITCAVVEALQVARLGNCYPEWTEVHFQNFSYAELGKSFLGGNIPPPAHSFYNLVTSSLQSKLINTECVGRDMVSNPVDLVVLNGEEIVILDEAGPYHCLKNVTSLIPVHIRLSPFGQLVLMPHNRNQIMVTSAKKNRFLLLSKVKKDMFAQWTSANGASEWPLPGSANVVAGTERVYTSFGNCLFVYDHTNRLEFRQIFQSPYKQAKFRELCYVQEGAITTDFYLASNAADQVAVLKLDKSTKDLVSWTNINLSLLCLDGVFKSPMMSACGPDGSLFVWDRQSTKLFTWNINTNAFTVIADFCTKSPHVMKMCNSYIYAILYDGSVARTERIKVEG